MELPTCKYLAPFYMSYVIKDINMGPCDSMQDLQKACAIPESQLEDRYSMAFWISPDPEGWAAEDGTEDLVSSVTKSKDY